MNEPFHNPPAWFLLITTQTQPTLLPLILSFTIQTQFHFHLPVQAHPQFPYSTLNPLPSSHRILTPAIIRAKSNIHTSLIILSLALSSCSPTPVGLNRNLPPFVKLSTPLNIGNKSWMHNSKPFKHNHTWDLVPFSSVHTLVGSKWVYKIKWEADENVQQYKAHLVAKGYLQTPKIDYGETYSPVIKPASITIVLAIVVTWPTMAYSIIRYEQCFSSWLSP